MMEKETMTSRERVLRTIAHKPVDRVPIDFGMTSSTGISAFGYHDLRKYLGLPVDTVEVVDMMQFTARVEEDVLQRFHCDTMLLNPPLKHGQIWNPRGEYRFKITQAVALSKQEDGSWVAVSKQDEHKSIRMPEGGYFFDGPWLHFDDRTEEEKDYAYKLAAEHIYHETEYFTMYMGYYGYFWDHPDFLCDMLLEPEKIHENNKRALEREMKRAARHIELFGNHIQGICTGSDLGTQSAPCCNPDVYGDVSAPYLKRFCDFIHQNSDWKIFFHSCGAMEPFIPILIECGIDVLNPVQISCSNMEPAALKKKYGEKITFWGGGCDTQNILGIGTPEDVRANVRQLMSIFKPGGGYVFNQVHNIMGNVPPENVSAMFDEAFKCSFYTA